MLHFLHLCGVAAGPVIRNAAKSNILSSLTLIHIGQVLIQADEVFFSFSSQTTGGKKKIRAKEKSSIFFLW